MKKFRNFSEQIKTNRTPEQGREEVGNRFTSSAAKGVSKPAPHVTSEEVERIDEDLMKARQLYAQTYAKHGKTIAQSKDAQQKAYDAVEKKHGADVLSKLKAHHQANEEVEQIEEMDKSQTPPGRDGGHQFGPGPKVSKKDINAVKKDPAKHLSDLFAKQYAKKQVVAEAGNKPLEKSYIGTGDTRTPRELKTQMQGASDEFVRSTADKKTGLLHSKVAKMQGKLAKSELRRREQGVAEEVEQIDEKSDEAYSHYKNHVLPIYKKHGLSPEFAKAVNNHVAKHGSWQVYNHHGDADGRDPHWFDSEKQKVKPIRKKSGYEVIEEEVVAEADKHSFVGKIQRGHELKKKVDSTWKDIGDAQKAGDKEAGSKAFRNHVRYTNLERPGTWTKSKDEGMAEEVEQIEEGRPSQRHPLEGHEYHKKSNEALIHIAKDAHKAAEAMKGHNTAAENKYRDQANDSATVRYYRQKHGMADWYKKKYGHVNEAKDPKEYGYEGDMAMNQLKTITRHAEYLMDMMKPDTDLPEWVQSKITLATDYIQTACDYMTSEMNEAANPAQQAAIAINMKKKGIKPKNEEVEIDEATNFKPPFLGPYKKSKDVVTDKSGAKHSKLSRVKHLAKLGMKKVNEEGMGDPGLIDTNAKLTLAKKKTNIVKSAAKNAKEKDSNKFNADPVLSSPVAKQNDSV